MTTRKGYPNPSPKSTVKRKNQKKLKPTFENLAEIDVSQIEIRNPFNSFPKERGKVRRERGVSTFGNVVQRDVGSFRLDSLFEKDGKPKKNIKEKVGNIVSRLERRKGKKDRRFRLRIGSSDSAFVTGSLETEDYVSDIAEAIGNFEKLFEHYSPAIMKEKLAGGFPLVHLVSFENKRDTKKHNRAMYEYRDFRKIELRKMYDAARTKSKTKAQRKREATIKAQWRKRTGRH